MKKNLILYLFLIIIISIIAFSCKRTEVKENIKSANVKNIKKNEVLEYFDIDTSWHYINNNFHSYFQDTIDSFLEIRFSTQGTFFQPNKYLILKYNGTNWRGIIGLHPKILNEIKEFQKDITPKCGWEMFEDSLIFFDLNSFKNIDFEGDACQNRFLDGYILFLEIITPNQYKIYSFPHPNSLFKIKYKSESLKKMERFYNFINDNFDNYYRIEQ